MAFQVTEVQRHLKGADYPMDGDALAKLAEGNGADQELVDALRGISGTVDGPNTVMQHLSGSLGGETGGAKDRSPGNPEGPAFQVDEVQGYLKGASYPSSGDDLAKVAQGNGAPDDFVELIRGVGQADGPNKVMQELKGHLGGAER